MNFIPLHKRLKHPVKIDERKLRITICLKKEGKRMHRYSYRPAPWQGGGPRISCKVKGGLRCPIHKIITSALEIDLILAKYGYYR